MGDLCTFSISIYSEPHRSASRTPSNTDDNEVDNSTATYDYASGNENDVSATKLVTSAEHSNTDEHAAADKSEVEVIGVEFSDVEPSDSDDEASRVSNCSK